MHVDDFSVEEDEVNILLTPITRREEMALLRLLHRFYPERADVCYSIVYDDYYWRLRIRIKNCTVCRSDQKTEASTLPTGQPSATA